MLLKNTLLIAAICFTASAQAAFTTCVLESEPCDQAGGHFFCSVVGWTGPVTPRFCSDHDASTGPGMSHTNPVSVPFSYCQDTRGHVSIANFQPSGSGSLGTAQLYFDGKRGELNCGVSSNPASPTLVACSGSIVESPSLQTRLRISFPTASPEKIGVLEVSEIGKPSTVNDMIPIICY